VQQILHNEAMVLHSAGDCNVGPDMCHVPKYRAQPNGVYTQRQ
jgi:hypothetical protein